jgi:hypothetical protein
MEDDLNIMEFGINVLKLVAKLNFLLGKDGLASASFLTFCLWSNIAIS